jgi:exopolysaccharide biosynthesis predicted pyruvyltransferase EpsI
LRFVKNADYIITDTFHGTIFSIKYHKKFCTFIRDSNSEKISDLLNTFNLIDRSIKNTDGLEKVLDTPINYDAVNNHIECQKDRTLEFLKKHLESKSIPMG